MTRAALPGNVVAATATTRSRRRRPSFAYVLSSGYIALIVVFGLLPALYAVKLAFTDGAGGFAGFSNFSKVIDDFRFMPALQHVALFMVLWLLMLIVIVVAISVVVHTVRVRWVNASARLIFYLPGALAGASSVLLWLFVLDPSAGPAGAILDALGWDSFAAVIEPSHLPVIFAVIAFWTGAGGWVVVMYGALNNISSEVMEAARIDGATPFGMAWHIQIPLIRKWITYMAVISLAGGTQLFVEPQLLSQASNGIVGNDYSVNQLAYLYAFQQNDFNGSAAISILLLLVALALSAVFVLRGGLFEKD